MVGWPWKVSHEKRNVLFNNFLVTVQKLQNVKASVSRLVCLEILLVRATSLVEKWKRWEICNAEWTNELNKGYSDVDKLAIKTFHFGSS